MRGARARTCRLPSRRQERLQRRGPAFTREEIDYPDTNVASSNRVPRLSRTVWAAPMTQRLLRRRTCGSSCRFNQPTGISEWSKSPSQGARGSRAGDFSDTGRTRSVGLAPVGVR